MNRGQSNFEFEYFGEFETEFKTILEYESGARWVRLVEKSRGQKSRATVPLKQQNINFLVDGSFAGFFRTVWITLEVGKGGCKLHM